jgi:Uncharacterized conserved protein (DUF2043)
MFMQKIQKLVPDFAELMAGYNVSPLRYLNEMHEHSRATASIPAKQTYDTSLYITSFSMFFLQLAVQASKSRVIEFTGSFKPVKWKCRAPLANGLLCERMDRHKVS